MDKPRRTWTWPRIIAALMVSVGFLACTPLLYRVYQEIAAEQRWRGEIESLGGVVQITGSTTGSSAGRIPILGELLAHERHVELVLGHPATAEAVLDKAAEFPKLRRVWVDVTTYDRSIKDRILKKLPAADVIFYTLPGATAPAGAGTVKKVINAAEAGPVPSEQ